MFSFRPTAPTSFHPTAPIQPFPTELMIYDQEPPDPGAVETKVNPGLGDDVVMSQLEGDKGPAAEEMSQGDEASGPEPARQLKKARKRDGEAEDSSVVGKVSYAHKLTDTVSGGKSGRAMFFDEGSREEVEVVEDEENVGNVIIPSELASKFAEDWDAAVVIKLVGRKITFETLQDRLRKLWSMAKDFSVHDVENGFFIVRFASTDERQNILKGGPWVIMGHYLHVEKWTPEFEPWSNVMNTVVAWIRLPGLPIHLYRAKVLTAITKRIGPVVAWDVQTQSSSRGKYARVAVRLNLDKPLCAKYKINGRLFRVEYENLPQICFHCGRYGHVRASCSELVQMHVEKEQNPKNLASHAKDKRSNGDLRQVACESEVYGEWMVVDRRRRGPSTKLNQATVQNKRGGQVRGSGSRYEVLYAEDHGNEAQQNQNVQEEGMVFSALANETNSSIIKKRVEHRNKGHREPEVVALFGKETNVGKELLKKADVIHKGKSKVNDGGENCARIAGSGSAETRINFQLKKAAAKDNNRVVHGKDGAARETSQSAAGCVSGLSQGVSKIIPAVSTLDPKFHTAMQIDNPRSEGKKSNHKLGESGKEGRPPDRREEHLTVGTKEDVLPSGHLLDAADGTERVVGEDESGARDIELSPEGMEEDQCYGTMVPCSIDL